MKMRDFHVRRIRSLYVRIKVVRIILKSRRLVYVSYKPISDKIGWYSILYWNNGRP